MHFDIKRGGCEAGADVKLGQMKRVLQWEGEAPAEPECGKSAYSPRCGSAGASPSQHFSAPLAYAPLVSGQLFAISLWHLQGKYAILKDSETGE